MPSAKRGNAKRGRPSLFKSEYVEQARKLCLLGATDEELAGFFGVSASTIDKWKVAHPDFLRSLKAGKLVADAEVSHRLYRRALGYSHRAVKIFMPAGADGPVYAPYVERYPPDTTAAIFWLKNRKPAQWRDRPPEETPDAMDTARQIREALRQMADADGLDDAA